MSNHDTPTAEQGTSESFDAAASIPDGVPKLNAFAIERLSHAFENSAKRWELIVYPSLFAFIILAAYGFYLIFSLAKDVHHLAISVDTNMTSMSNNMLSISNDITRMSHDIETLVPMLNSIQNMDRSMQSMTLSTASMRHDMAGMNQSIGRPAQFMNQFAPW